MSLSSHIQELRRKHQHLAAQVDAAQRNAGTDSLTLANLKKQKLRIKEEIERLQVQ